MDEEEEGDGKRGGVERKAGEALLKLWRKFRNCTLLSAPRCRGDSALQ